MSHSNQFASDQFDSSMMRKRINLDSSYDNRHLMSRTRNMDQLATKKSLGFRGMLTEEHDIYNNGNSSDRSSSQVTNQNQKEHHLGDNLQPSKVQYSSFQKDNNRQSATIKHRKRNQSEGHLNYNNAIEEEKVERQNSIKHRPRITVEGSSDDKSINSSQVPEQMRFKIETPVEQRTISNFNQIKIQDEKEATGVPDQHI